MQKVTISVPYDILVKLQAYIAREYPDRSRVLSAIICKAIDEFLEREGEVFVQQGSTGKGSETKLE